MSTGWDTRTRGDVEDTLSGNDPGSVTRWELAIGGHYIGSGSTDPEEPSSVYEVSWEGGGDGEARQLIASLAIGLTQDVVGEDVKLDLLIGGDRVRSFTGKMLRPRTKLRRSEITAVTAGYFNQVLCYGEAVSYSGQRPEEVYYDALHRNPFYINSDFDVAPSGVPLMAADGSAAIKPTDSIKDVLSVVVAQAEYMGFDTPLNGHHAFIDIGPLASTGSIWQYTVGIDIDPESWAFEPADENDYTHVFPYREVDNVIYPLVDDVGIAIPDSSAPFWSPYKIDIGDNTTDSAARAFEKAYLVAQRIAQKPQSGTFEALYINPYVTPGEKITILEPFQDELGEGLRTWVARVRTEGGRLGTQLRHAIEVEQVMISEVRI